MAVITAKKLLKKTGILTAEPDDTLESVALKLRTSHDAVFVVDDEELMGVINPYHSLFSSRYPGTTKVKNCLFHPPKLALDTTLSEIAHQMRESKVYYLPVYDDLEWKGIVTIRRIFKYLIKYPDHIKQLTDFHSGQSLITISKDASVSDAYAKLKQERVSRLPVVNGHQRLVGMITRHDLRSILTTQERSQRRFSRTGDKQKQLDQSIQGHFRRDIVTANSGLSLIQLIKLMIDNQTSSIVEIDSQNTPRKIYTQKDVLTALSRM